MPRPKFVRRGVYDKQLEELVQTSSWKQALTLCEKRIKKGDISDESLVAKAHVLRLWPNPDRESQGVKELEAIITKAQPVTDPNVLASIAQVAHYRRGPFNTAIWERAIRARPKDEEIYKTWFLTAFILQAWDAAQKAAIAYRSAFPKRREPHFWYIVVNQLLSIQPPEHVKDQRMYSQLSYLTLAKAASNAGIVPKTGVAIASLEELLLLLTVYRQQGKYREAVDILNDDRIGINSQIGNNAWELVRLKIEFLDSSGQYEEEWRYCRALLDDARPETVQEKAKTHQVTFGSMGDDWKVWSGFISAAFQIGTEENKKSTESFIEAYRKCSRNAQLALLVFLSSGLKESTHAQFRLLAACRDYFKDYARKLVCFYDLNPYIGCLDQSRQVELLKDSAQEAKRLQPYSNDPELKAVQWLTSEINALKLDYYMVISKHPNYTNQPLLEAFICNCLRLYRLSLVLGMKLAPSERRPGDDAAVLAVMALFHLNKIDERTIMIRAAIILDMVVETSRHNYDALLLLIRLHLWLGMGTMAVDCYSRLCVKNVQHATLSWIILGRISLLNPYSLSPPSLSEGKGRLIYRDPSETLTAALEWHISAHQIHTKSVSRMLSEGQYNTALTAISFGNAIENGFGRMLALVEFWRIQRLGAIPHDKDNADLDGSWTGNIVDNRDFTAFPSCESRFQGPEARVFMDRWLKTRNLNGTWISQQLWMAWFWEFVNSRTDADKGEPVAVLPGESDMVDGDIRVDYHEYQIVKILRFLCFLTSSPESVKDKRTSMLDLFDGLAAALEEFMRPLSEHESGSRKLANDFGSGVEAPDHHYYLRVLAALDICGFCKATISYLLDASSKRQFVDKNLLSAKCEELQSRILQIASGVESSVSRQKTTLQENNAAFQIARAVRFGPEVEQDAIGKVIETIISPAHLAYFAKNVYANWTHALDGVLQAKNALRLKSTMK